MKLYYIIDAYCGWTYGFNHIFTRFMQHHPDLEIEVINGGLFVGDNKKKMADFKQAQTINKQIETYYQMTFGEAYNQLFKSKDFTMDSLGPARAYSVLKNYVEPHQLAQLTLDIQALFFEDGLDLSQAGSYASILDTYQLPQKAMEGLSSALKQAENLHPDFIKAYEMGVTSFPTLLLEKDGNFFNLIHQVRTVDDLEKNFQVACNLFS
ncbi:thioredoxin [Streptococcus porcorum]|uniref:Thioredoxin n=1 Tax=Streptococcus porcorum TaxID=701526 RepID=A0ABV2JDB4_9STRE